MRIFWDDLQKHTITTLYVNWHVDWSDNALWVFNKTSSVSCSTHYSTLKRCTPMLEWVTWSWSSMPIRWPTNGYLNHTFSVIQSIWHLLPIKPGEQTSISYWSPYWGVPCWSIREPLGGSCHIWLTKRGEHSHLYHVHPSRTVTCICIPLVTFLFYFISKTAESPTNIFKTWLIYELKIR